MTSIAPQAPSLPGFIWDDALIQRYDLSGPRYTSYPTAVEFDQNYPIQHMAEAAARSKASGRSLSLYTHLPFYAHLCYYCPCISIFITSAGRKVGVPPPQCS